MRSSLNLSLPMSCAERKSGESRWAGDRSPLSSSQTINSSNRRFKRLQFLFKTLFSARLSPLPQGLMSIWTILPALVPAHLSKYRLRPIPVDSRLVRYRDRASWMRKRTRVSGIKQAWKRSIIIRQSKTLTTWHLWQTLQPPQPKRDSPTWASHPLVSLS